MGKKKKFSNLAKSTMTLGEFQKETNPIDNNKTSVPNIMPPPPVPRPPGWGRGRGRGIQQIRDNVIKTSSFLIGVTPVPVHKEVSSKARNFAQPLHENEDSIARTSCEHMMEQTIDNSSMIIDEPMISDDNAKVEEINDMKNTGAIRKKSLRNENESEEKGDRKKNKVQTDIRSYVTAVEAPQDSPVESWENLDEINLVKPKEQKKDWSKKNVPEYPMEQSPPVIHRRSTIQSNTTKGTDHNRSGSVTSDSNKYDRRNSGGSINSSRRDHDRKRSVSDDRKHSKSKDRASTNYDSNQSWKRQGQSYDSPSYTDKKYSTGEKHSKNLDRHITEKNDQSSRHNSSRPYESNYADESQSRKSRWQQTSVGRKNNDENIGDEFDMFEKWEKSKKYEMQTVCKIQDKFGDLFTAPKEYSLAHCVAEDLRMGSGIAVGFRNIFKHVDDLMDQRQRQGGLALLQDGDRFIYYMITKKISTGKPTYPSFFKSLTALRNHIAENKVTKLAMPKIGCGLDRLEWSIVLNMIKFVFQKVDVEIVIYDFQQNDSTSAPQSYSRSVPIVHRLLPLVDIESMTALLFVASEDRKPTPEITSLDNKYQIRADYTSSTKKMGEIIFIKKREYVFGLVVRKTLNDPISWTSFANCLKEFNQINRGKDQCEYVGIQAVKDNDDDIWNLMTVEKMITLFKMLRSVEVHICYPIELKDYLPIRK